MANLNPLRVTKAQACDLLSIGREKLRLLAQNDPTFPKPYKTGQHRQSQVYFDYAELVAWYESQKEAC